MTDTPSAPAPAASRWQALARGFLRAFHAYAGWLVSISWWRFALLSLLLMIGASMLQSLPPFRWTIRETISAGEHGATPPLPSLPPVPPVPPVPGAPPATPAPPALPGTAASVPGAAASAPGRQLIRIDKGDGKGVEIAIDGQGVRIRQTAKGATAASTPSAAASAADGEATVDIKLPPGVSSEGVREAVDEARRTIAEAVQEARDEARQAREEARQAAQEAGRSARDVAITMGESDGPQTRIRTVRWGDFLTDLAAFWIIASIAIKATYTGRVRAEAKAAQAVEAAEAESLKRQVVEARMAAMQAQVEPHFLFNTLASIDHLIEVDPPRASQMQKHLIALLRATMPTMREASGQGGAGNARDLGRELAVIRPYLEILKVRMEERLATEIDVPEGLLSAEFPPMMVQTLVENAIKHGLEPKAEGGKLTLKAEIVHGKLAVTVADTGLGFGQAPTAGTGVGLANIRERLQLLYGPKGSLTITENPGGGTRVTLTVPYRTLEQASA